MLTRVFARALAPEVRVCGVAPGPVAVEPGQEERRAAETLLGRVGSPDDVAEAVALSRRGRTSSPARRSSSTAGSPAQSGLRAVSVKHLDVAFAACPLRTIARS